MTPRVSVLLPVYGGASHVGDAIASVLGQTYGDFELLVLDDCSPDESAAIAERFGDRRTRIIRNDRNLGQVATLNRGLREATGEYIARLDQDDICSQRRFERQVALLDADPSVAVVGTWVDVVDDHGARVDDLRTQLEDRSDTLLLILENRLPLAHPSVMFRAGPVRDAGGYDESVRYCEDMDLWRRLVLGGHALRVVSEPLLRYRVHAGQQSNTHWAEQQANNDASLERFIAALAPSVDARLVRIAFTRRLELWDELEDRSDALRLVHDLELLLTATAADAKLERGVRAHVARTARVGWRTGLRRWLRLSPALARFGRRRAGYAATVAIAPALTLARTADRALRR
ncbi:MAG TPA: glycosyltransferase [Gaiellaceae bacterium]|nr:glycosyltransferase [Gaiellaceae bacterium]